MPVASSAALTISNAKGPPNQTPNAANGNAASEPTLPAATGDKPQPNQVESQTAGCEKASGSRGIGSERQAQCRHRLRRDAFAAAGEAQTLGGRRLDADARRVDREDFCNARNHGRTVRTDLRTLADQRDVDMRDAAAGLGDEIRRAAQEAMRRRAAPLRIARREMNADVAGAERTENGIGQRMQAAIGVAVPDEAVAV